MAVRSFRDLEVWQIAHELTLAVYRATAVFPKHEMFGLTSQLRRSAASVPANIAEGWGRRSTKDYLRHLSNANGSLEESRYFLLLARDLSYLAGEQSEEMEVLATRIASMIHALEGALQKRMAVRADAVDRTERPEIAANGVPSQSRNPQPGARGPIPATRNP